jgi:hypothetical protein
MEYQVLLKGLELKRDMEVQLVQNGASRADNGSVAGLSASFESWLTTNVSRASGGTPGASGGFRRHRGGSDRRQHDLPRAFTETLLKTVLAACYTAGGKPTVLMLDPTQKQTFSGFAGLSQSKLDIPVKGRRPRPPSSVRPTCMSPTSASSAPCRTSSSATSRRCWCRPKFVKVAFLRSMRNWALAKTGDADSRQLLVEFTLEMLNEAAHGIVADLT